MSDNEIRDQLAALLAERQRCCPSRGRARADAEAILAAGWRPPARVIETDEEFDALPIGTLLVDQWGSAWQRGYEEVVGRQTWDAPDRVVLPATVLWTPEVDDHA